MMTLAVLIGAAILSAGYVLRRQGLDTLDFRAGQIRLVRVPAPAAEKADGTRRQSET
ncbi:MAG TPA: hypothetical protein VNS88_00800 [Nitrospiraceae bacterium]|nr:hypothetical protein [Nitrospiraceae bacterium]